MRPNTDANLVVFAKPELINDTTFLLCQLNKLEPGMYDRRILTGSPLVII